MKIVYDEWYGNLSYAQRAAYRKHNISPSDHTLLVERFGADAHAEITKFVKDCAAEGNSVFTALAGPWTTLHR